ncbi:MAG: hypothetical protein IIY07_06680 [Thermoguttaceae bacterium]|nr:hypothetical protein [Thermoguttaceae bacterium]
MVILTYFIGLRRLSYMIWEENSSNDFAVRRRRNAPPRRSTLKNQRRKYRKTDDSTDDAKTPTVDDESGKSAQTRPNDSRIARGIERPKLTVYPPKFKRYFKIVQQEPRKLLTFRTFFYIFPRFFNVLFYPFYTTRHFLPSRFPVVFLVVSSVPILSRRRSFRPDSRPDARRKISLD